MEVQPAAPRQSARKVAAGAAATFLGIAASLTCAAGLAPLGRLPGDVNSIANGVNGDGAIVVGYATSATGQEAFRRTAGGGIRRPWDVPLAHGVNPAADGWTKFVTATGVSFDGNTIVGAGTRNGHSEAFLAVVPEPTAAALLVAGGMLAVRRRLRD